MLSLEDIRDAAERLRGVGHRTPVVTSSYIDGLVGAEVFFTCENLQRAGTFKIRGAYNAISRLSPEQLERGVVAHSSGNHAQAVALAARILGTSAVVLMPEDAPATKLEATRNYGAEVVTFDRYAADRPALMQRIVDEQGRAPISPYDNHDVMAGQGTVALEIFEELGSLDTLIVQMSSEAA